MNKLHCKREKKQMHLACSSYVHSTLSPDAEVSSFKLRNY